MRRFLRTLFVPANKLYPKAWWCPSCQEAHYAKMQHGWS